MALSAIRSAIVITKSTVFRSTDERKQGNLHSNLSMTGISPSPQWSSSHLVAKRQLHAIATNSRVLQLEQEREDGDLLTEAEVAEVVKDEEPSPPGPSAREIHSLLTQVCETSSIAEVELKVGTFSLRVRREIGKAAKPVVAQGSPVQVKATIGNTAAAGATNGSASAPSNKSTKLAKTTPPKAAADGGLLFVSSPKVGLFRQGRTVKGKSGPPLCVEGQVVKKGQVVCYLEQLGTQQPVETDVGGEIENILFKNGDPVGYGDRLIAIRP